jgi:C4-dicarboxylate-specific signal transduction histidine kinase
VREHALEGQKAVTELLEHLVRHGREKPERFALLEALSPLLDMVRAASRREGIQLLVEIPEGLEVRSRKGELEQVLLSLIRNAADSLRARPQGGAGARRIALRGRRLEEAVVIDVVDSGGGVAKAVEPRLFELAVSDKDSTGVGLYLAAALAERNGGSLSYFPVEAGSCFRLALPVP